MFRRVHDGLPREAPGSARSTGLLLETCGPLPAAPDPAPEARAFWAEVYPSMRTTAGNVAAAQRAGWAVAGTHLLPDADGDAYDGPLASGLDRLRDDGVPPELRDEVGREIGIRHAHGADYGYADYGYADYGYTGYVLRPR